MAIDMEARRAWGREDWGYLFRYLNGQSTTRQLEILEDINNLGGAVGTWKHVHEAEMGTAGIGAGADRLQLCCALVAEKAVRIRTWGQFVDAYNYAWQRMAPDWQKEMAAFWAKTGLAGPREQADVVPLGARPDLWAINDLSVDGISLVATVGVSAFTGSITFNSFASGDHPCAIGMVGLSAGKSASLIPKMSASWPTAVHFPNLTRWMEDGESVVSLAIDKLSKTARPSVAALLGKPGVKDALRKHVPNGDSPSYGAAQWWAKTIGTVSPFRKPAPVSAFKGTCAMIAAQGSVPVLSGGEMLLVLGMQNWNPFTAKAVASVLTVGKSAALPQAGVTGTIFFGEIV